MLWGGSIEAPHQRLEVLMNSDGNMACLVYLFVFIQPVIRLSGVCLPAYGWGGHKQIRRARRFGNDFKITTFRGKFTYLFTYWFR